MNKMGHERPITIGRIDYANVWPIFDHFEDCLERSRAHNVNIMTGVPSVLNRALKSGDADLSAISSFAYGQLSEELVLLPDLSVSADGEVMSIFLFLKKPLEEVLQGTITVTNTSATSVNLLRIILHGRFQASPRYVTMEPNLDEMLQEADAALLIGDPAIRASWRSDHGCEMLDVGRLWKEWTGLGMTFAVLAVRESAVREAPETVRAAAEALNESKRIALASLDRLAAKAASAIGGDTRYWSRYFQCLKYGFGEREREGLALYFRYAYQLGLLQHEVKLRFWSDHTVAQVNE
jgi:chorismate dehydratase